MVFALSNSGAGSKMTAMNHLSPSLAVVAVAMLLAAIPLHSQTITFETLPTGAALTGGTVISNQFAVAPYGVSFSFEDGTFPVIRRVGGSSGGKPTAFYGYPDDTGHNTPAPGQNVGTNFLSDDGKVDAPPAPFIITYSSPVAEASAFVLDVDHFEAWDIYARDSQTQVLAMIRLQHDTPGTGDGIATPFSFNFPSNVIKSLRIVFTGDTNEQTKIGLAFDSFSPTTRVIAPAPATLGIQRLPANGGSTNHANVWVYGTPNAVYAPQYTVQLAGTNSVWVNLGSFIMPASGQYSLLNNMNTNRFFRVLGLQ